MIRHPIRKVFGLAFLYIIIIFGIFGLQFRSRSVFSQNFGFLRLTLSENKNSESQQPYADMFQVSGNGITLFSDKNAHIEVTHSNGKKQDLEFSNWKPLSETAFQLQFANNISLKCEALGQNKDIFSIAAFLPKNISSISIPYSHAGSYTITDLTDKRAILRSKDKQTMLSASKVTSSRIYLQSNHLMATYAPYNPVEAFSFTQLASLTAEQTEIYKNILQQNKTALATSFLKNPDSASEVAVSAYIAEMGSQGKYIEAINNIPSSFKNGSKRTYLTAPQLNNLVAMNKSMVMYNENMTYNMNHSISTGNLDIFLAENLAAFILRQNFENASKLLSLPSASSNIKPTLMQAVGILEVYCDLKKASSPLASKIQSGLPVALKIIEDSCSLQDDILIMQENGQLVSLTNAVRTAVALRNFGEIEKDSSYITGGTLLLISHSQIDKTSDLTNLAQIYTILNKNNTYLPHEVVLKPQGKPQIWAWTVAQDFTCSVDSEKTLILTTTFPQGSSHYMIINGIEPFTEIEIYGMQFRTDQRFESYNSSGYVYDSETKTLFLKQRHKVNNEIVKLYYKPKQVAPKKVEPVEETKTEAEATEVTEEEISNTEVTDNTINASEDNILE